MSFRLFTEVIHVDVSFIIAPYDDNPHACHDSRGRIGSVSRRGNQAHVAVAFAARLVVGADDHQPRKLPLRA